MKAILILAILILSSASALACSCLITTVQEQIGRSPAIFAGTVVSYDTIGFVRSTADPARVVFNVSKVWKGEVHEYTEVQTAVSGASCGYEFEEGEEYLVYASEGDPITGADGLSVGLCSRTAKLADAQEDLQVLGGGRPPLPGERKSPEGALPALMTVAAVLAGWVLVARRH